MKSFRKIFVTGLLALLVLACAMFFFQNATVTHVKFLNFESPKVPLFVVMLGCILSGIAVTGFFAFLEVVKLNRKIRKQERVITDLKSQVHKMKTDPLLESFHGNTKEKKKSKSNDDDDNEDGPSISENPLSKTF